jgi:hypothetical protein
MELPFDAELGVHGDRGVAQTGICPTDHKPNASKKILKKTILTITYMIFRTGNILILGKCIEPVIRHLYTHMKRILEVEREYVESGRAVG